MAIHTTTIDGFTVELATDGETGAECTECTVTSGRFHASLQCMIDFGALEDDAGATLAVASGTIDRIEAWAVGHGY